MTDGSDDRLDEYSNLARGILLQAVRDLNLTDEYERETNKKAAERYRTSALVFIRSPWFREICNSLGYAHDAVKLSALS